MKQVSPSNNRRVNMQENSINTKQDISMAIILLCILKKKNMINGQTYENVYSIYKKMLKEVA